MTWTAPSLTINNVLQAADEKPHDVIALIQWYVDGEPLATVKAMTGEMTLATLQEQLAYFSNLNGYLTALWSVMKHATKRNEPGRIAIRDGLEAAASVSRQKYEAVSRIFSVYEHLTKETRMDNGIRR